MSLRRELDADEKVWIGELLEDFNNDPERYEVSLTAWEMDLLIGCGLYLAQDGRLGQFQIDYLERIKAKLDE